jgi:hypothetical protein
MEASSESIAGDGVADRQREEGEPDGQHDEVKHLMLLATTPKIVPPVLRR